MLSFRRRERRPDLEVGGGEQAPGLHLGRRELAGDDERPLPVPGQRVEPRVARAGAFEADRGAEEHRRLPARGLLAQRLAGELAGGEQALGGGRRARLPARDLEIEEARREHQPGSGRIALAAQAHDELGELGAGEPLGPRCRGELGLDGAPTAVVEQRDGGEGGQQERSDEPRRGRARQQGREPGGPPARGVGRHLFRLEAWDVVQWRC